MVSGLPSRLFKVVGNGLVGHQLLSVLGADAVLLHIPRLALVRQGGELRPQTIEGFLVKHDRRKVGIREIPVVVRVLFCTHCIRFSGVLIEAAGFLPDRLAGLERLHLPGKFVFDGLDDELEGVEVFHLGAGAEGFARLVDR